MLLLAASLPVAATDAGLDNTAEASSCNSPALLLPDFPAPMLVVSRLPEALLWWCGLLCKGSVVWWTWLVWWVSVAPWVLRLRLAGTGLRGLVGWGGLTAALRVRTHGPAQPQPALLLHPIFLLWPAATLPRMLLLFFP